MMSKRGRDFCVMGCIIVLHFIFWVVVFLCSVDMCISVGHVMFIYGCVFSFVYISYCMTFSFYVFETFYFIFMCLISLCPFLFCGM